MNYVEYLNEYAIEGKMEGRKNYRMPCYACGSDNNLSMRVDNGAFRCFSCNVKGTFARLCKGHSIPSPTSLAAPSLKWNTDWNNDRAEEYAELRALKDASNFGFDEDKNAIVFAYKNELGMIRGLKYKYLNGGYNIKGDCKLFIPSPEKYSNKDEVYVVEGEFCALTLNEFGLNAVATGGQPNENHIAALKEFKRVFLCFDQDSAGQGFTDTVQKVIKERSLVVKFPYKDPNEFLQAGGSRDEWMEYVEDAAPYESKLVVGFKSLIPDMVTYLKDKDRVKGEPTGFEELDELLGGGMRKGELTVLMAEAKTGKNKLMHKIMLNQLEKRIPLGYASRELSGDKEVLPNLYSIALQKNMLLADMTEELEKKVYDISKDWELYFADGYGYFPLEDMREWVNTLRARGVEYFFWDHLHYSLDDPEDHHQASKLIKDIKTLVKELDIHFMLICQPNKLLDGQRLGINSLKGGSSIGQAMDSLLTFERVKGEQCITRLGLDKARFPLAKEGHLFLKYFRDTMDLEGVEFIEVEEEEEEAPKFRRASIKNEKKN